MSTVTGQIESTPGVCGGKPRVAGTRIRVQDIYAWYELQGKSADEIVTDFPQLTMSDVFAALAYYWAHAAEIQAQIKADEEFVAQLKQQLGPGPLEEKGFRGPRAEALSE